MFPQSTTTTLPLLQLHYYYNNYYGEFIMGESESEEDSESGSGSDNIYSGETDGGFSSGMSDLELAFLFVAIEGFCLGLILL